MYSALQDKNPMSTNFKVPPGLSSVDIIDFSLSRFVNFQSEITFPEEGGILQVDNVGMHIKSTVYHTMSMVYSWFIALYRSRTSACTSTSTGRCSRG